MAKKKKAPKLGTGKRFSAVKSKVASYYEKKGKTPEEAQRIGAAIAAKQGQKKYGVKKMTKWAVKGKKRKK